MELGTLAAIALFLLVAAVAVRALGKVGRGRTFGGGPGPGAAGAVYDMLNEDKRNAIEIIVEGRAEYRDPETADDIPDDESPDGKVNSSR
jgi:hypothetical protein